ncbi:MAG: alpha/beta fold hydrolase [Novosphingobium sp.]
MAVTAETGSFIDAGAVRTHYHDSGTGAPLLLIHGSGPGVSAWANWRFTIADLSPRFRCIAPDMAGFGQTRVGDDFAFGLEAWRGQLLAFLDALNLDKVDVVGNSFGGALALALAIAAPDRVGRLVLMGSVGVPFAITPGLDAVWGYTPGIDSMSAIMDYFAHDRSLLGEDLVRLRYEASIQPGVQESYAAMFPAPRQRWVDALTHDEADLRAIRQPTLIVHGRDDRVIPLETSLALNRFIDNSQLHVFGRCGHWTQIEHRRPFARLLADFLENAIP